MAHNLQQMIEMIHLETLTYDDWFGLLWREVRGNQFNWGGHAESPGLLPQYTVLPTLYRLSSKLLRVARSRGWRIFKGTIFSLLIRLCSVPHQIQRFITLGLLRLWNQKLTIQDCQRHTRGLGEAGVVQGPNGSTLGRTGLTVAKDGMARRPRPKPCIKCQCQEQVKRVSASCTMYTVNIIELQG